MKSDNIEKSVQVKFSEIHGSGIFSIRNIEKDEIIFVIEGEIIDEAECIRREEEENNVYIFWNDKNYIDTANSEITKYLNHSCEPNAYVDDNINNENSLVLKSLRKINIGEEITIDYGYDEIYENCKCDSCNKKKG